MTTDREKGQVRPPCHGGTTGTPRGQWLSTSLVQALDIGPKFIFFSLHLKHSKQTKIGTHITKAMYGPPDRKSVCRERVSSPV